MTPYFEKLAQKGDAFLKEVAVELGDTEDPKRTMRVTRAVLHALRSKISPQESLQMLSQLPLFIKAIYVDGWKWNSEHTKIRHLDDFLALVKKEVGVTGEYDFRNNKEIEDASRAVFNVLKKNVSEGEIKDIKQTLPPELRELF